MIFTETKLSGVLLIQPDIKQDARGVFLECFRSHLFEARGIKENFVQDNVSRSVRGVLRGLHYQLKPHAQGKLIRVSQGEIFDVAVDLRKKSPTFGKWLGYILNDDNRWMLYIPPGFAHGFCILSDVAEVHYKCTDYYIKEYDRAIQWNDSAIGIDWPVGPNLTLMSERDLNAPPLREAEVNF
jgi:dTDP-4-dehydrorhamnose 3,5-epimerase